MRKVVITIILAAFLANSLVPASLAQNLSLPPAGQMVSLSPAFHPPVLNGLKIFSDDPFRFEFILDKGDDASAISLPLVGRDQGRGDLKDEANKLIRYFLASLTVPEKDMWVNLSPYEKDRIIPDSFGLTGMGRDLLAQDYLLKQITASLIYPEGDTGKKFWAEVYKQAQEKYGTTDIPVDTFNKVWIVPAKAVVYENAKAGTAYVVESKLKVMLETDYALMANNAITLQPTRGHVAPQGYVSPSTLPTSQPLNTQALQVSTVRDTSIDTSITKSILRDIVIPILEKEVNEGQNFALLRQVYQSFILAAWYKKKVKESLLSKVYVDQQKIKGVNIDDPKEAEKIWAQYVQAFSKGVFDLVREERDINSNELIPRKYFSGGVDCSQFTAQVLTVVDHAQIQPPVGAMVIDAKVISVAQISDSAQTFEKKDLQAEVDRKFDPGLSEVLSYQHGGLYLDGEKMERVGGHMNDIFAKGDLVYRVFKLGGNHRRGAFGIEAIAQLGIGPGLKAHGMTKEGLYVVVVERVYGKGIRFADQDSREYKDMMDRLHAAHVSIPDLNVTQFMKGKKDPDDPDEKERIWLVDGELASIISPQEYDKELDLLDREKNPKKYMGSELWILYNRVKSIIGEEDLSFDPKDVLRKKMTMAIINLIQRYRNKTSVIRANDHTVFFNELRRVRNEIIAETGWGRPITGERLNGIAGESWTPVEAVGPRDGLYKKVVERLAPQGVFQKEYVFNKGKDRYIQRIDPRNVNDLKELKVHHADGVLVPSIMRYLDALWQQIHDKTKSLDERKDALAHYEWWFFQGDPTGISGAAIVDGMSMVAQMSMGLKLREKYVHQRDDALSMMLEDYVAMRVKDFVEDKDASMRVQDEDRVRELIQAVDLKRVSGGFNSFGDVYEVKDKRSPLSGFVIKVPRQGTFEAELQDAKDHMGGILADFNTVSNVIINGVAYPFVVIQKKLKVFDDVGRLADVGEHVLLNGMKVNLPELEKDLIEEMAARGIFYPDALIAKNYGFDEAAGKLYLVDFGGAMIIDRTDKRFEGAVFETLDPMFYPRQVKGTLAFYKGMGDGFYFDKIGVMGDDALYALWGTRMSENHPVADVQVPVSTIAATEPNGGIDLQSMDGAMHVENGGDAIKFNITPQMLEQYNSVSGFEPVITSIRPLADLPQFLGMER